MFGRKTAIVLGVAGILSLASAPAPAFEQQQLPVGPSVVQPPAAVETPDGKKLKLDDVTPSGEKDSAKEGFKVPGLGRITVPKLNFGLDLMYGEKGKDEPSLGFTTPDADLDNDVRIMGKVKRRF